MLLRSIKDLEGPLTVLVYTYHLIGVSLYVCVCLFMVVLLHYKVWLLSGDTLEMQHFKSNKPATGTKKGAKIKREKKILGR